MQVSLLPKKGIKACGVYGGQDDEQVQKDVLKGEYRLVYFTPETIIGVKKWRNMKYILVAYVLLSLMRHIQ